ncbi:ATP-binding protein [Pseudobacter ginsenosidimutans]|uniref:Sugar lactone lactonase YvrE n=1 Tax=Pseudobacter ginsenosidimutans TaxID=661488 RepID=A0A4Q7N268_9BACT|nr:ATP-binding protein [Pseudobacter ginsenosidimutans]QEC43436.1 ATP-binding protein [Pseudobacter ginsenosidimutans]RZS74819.1 hypothetical protein EV199_0670 [Pseudobacter ginsenosidimutans]
MRKFFLIAFILVSFAASAQQLEKLWETDTVIAIPESVLHVPKERIMYVSLIDGPGWAVDGKGGVGKMSPDGKQWDGNWITGLNAPKGLGLHGNRLYVADVTEIVIIDVKNGKIEKKISLDSAKALNDVTIDDKGIVYVSDSRTGLIWKLENDIATEYLADQKGVNGLRAVGTDLYIAAGKNFRKADANKNITEIAILPQGGDGVELVGNGDFIVTAWAGYIFYVHKDGKVDTMLETHQQKKNTADIGYDPVKKIVYVPTFNGKTVAAYQLK